MTSPIFGRNSEITARLLLRHSPSGTRKNAEPPAGRQTNQYVGSTINGRQ